MRMSDWSSDVCPSDLPGDGGSRHLFVPPAIAEPLRMTRLRARRGNVSGVRGSDDSEHRRAPVPGRAAEIAAIARKPSPRRRDRQSVEEGKRVSVRVDCGGRCISKKTKRDEQTK